MYQNMPNMAMAMPTNMIMGGQDGVYEDDDDFCHFGPTSIKSNYHTVYKIDSVTDF